ncbi:helix-turn-helix domain-containing protein [Olivibacter ginsenosidimutans]|uniref:Helix-turn-helix domain-containing protein n=1 Tax=Olivibacter ginsenosidimutans TaxID=1176537 RepID=A0ABP9BG89_9SPHI
MKLSILLTKHYRLLSVAAIVDVFETANKYLEETESEKRFVLHFIGTERHFQLPEQFQKYDCSFFTDLTEPIDLIFIPAFQHTEHMPQNIQDNADCCAFLVSQYQQGVSLVSLCTGSFLLAAAGLLDGKEATTHVEAADKFARIFPQVKLQPHAIVTQRENIYTSGGATSSFHMKLLLIQQYCGRELAVRVAKAFAIDMDRNNQLYFEHFKPSLSNEDELVRAVQTAINQRFSEIKNVEEALDEVPSSRRNMIRRFKQATGMTPIRYLQKTKIEAAKQLLETTNRNILDIMVSSGYNDMKNFRHLFKTFTGLTPKGYRDKYGMRLG